MTVPDQPTMTDTIAADARAADPEAAAAAPETVPDTEFPEGAPEFWYLHRMPYGIRGRAAKRWSAIEDFQKAHPEIAEQEKAAAAARAAGQDPPEDVVDVEVMCDMLELIDQFLMSVAKDKKAYEDWPDRFTPNLFAQTFSAYQDASKPGEASSSSS